MTCSDACATEAYVASGEAFGAAGKERLAEARAAGQLEMTEDGRQRVAAATRSTVAAAREWQRTHRWPEPGTWERDYAPLLSSLSVTRLAQATGLSEAYCRRIKRGEVVPHPMWWETVQDVSAGQLAIATVTGAPAPRAADDPGPTGQLERQRREVGAPLGRSTAPKRRELIEM